MSFHQCPNCKEEIKYKTKLFSVFFGYRPVTCENCGTVYEVDEKFRFLLSLYTVMIPVILVYSISAMAGLDTRWIQVLMVLIFGSIGVLYAATKVRYHKAKHQPVKVEEKEKK
jgi:CXXC-20-CXXC protein